VAVLFCDVVGFTAYSEKHPPETVFGHDTGIAGSAGFPQTAPQRPARPAMGALLHLMSEGSDQQIATKA
jgi:hypothetical protein